MIKVTESDIDAVIEYIREASDSECDDSATLHITYREVRILKRLISLVGLEVGPIHYLITDEEGMMK